MQDHRLKRRNGAAVDPAAIEQFAKDFRGALIQPRDPTYDQARRIWNASIDKHPGLIARCSGTADVVHAVKFARAHDLLVAVRGGGHNVGGRALCDDGIVIDLSAMKGVFVDPQTRTAEVVTRIPNEQRTLRAGMFAEIEVRSRDKHDGIVIPASA